MSRIFTFFKNVKNVSRLVEWSECAVFRFKPVDRVWGGRLEKRTQKVRRSCKSTEQDKRKQSRANSLIVRNKSSSPNNIKLAKLTRLQDSLQSLGTNTQLHTQFIKTLVPNIDSTGVMSTVQSGTGNEVTMNTSQ